MAHISLSPPSGAGTFSPLAKAFDRTTKGGTVPVVNFLIGSHYNAAIGNEMTFDSTGNIDSDSVIVNDGDLEIAGKSTDGTDVTKISSFSPFMYFYPGLKIVGHLELPQAVLLGLNYDRIRYEFQDLATLDTLQIDFETGVINPQVIFREIINGVPTVLSTTQMSISTTEIYFELDFLDEGITKFYLIDKTAAGTKTRVYRGTLIANIAESKVACILLTNQTTIKTVKSDFIWIFYPKIFLSYDVALSTRLLGRVQVFDTIITADTDETNWREVFSSDHEFTGDRIIENGIVRLWFKPTLPGMSVYGWDGSAYILTTDVIPRSSQGDLGTTLHDIIFERFNNTQVVLNVKYGILEHIINLRRGTPYCRISATSNKFRINTTKERIVLSTKTTATEIPDFNQQNTDNTNRGNPLNLSPTVNPFIFTNDSNVNTGLQLLNDNYISWYNTSTAAETVGFIGFMERPIACTVTATDATTLSNITWGFTNLFVGTIGVLTGPTDTSISGILTIFAMGDDDTYVKYRANEGIWGFDQRMALRRKR